MKKSASLEKLASGGSRLRNLAQAARSMRTTSASFVHLNADGHEQDAFIMVSVGHPGADAMTRAYFGPNDIEQDALIIAVKCVDQDHVPRSWPCRVGGCLDVFNGAVVAALLRPRMREERSRRKTSYRRNEGGDHSQCREAAISAPPPHILGC